MLSFYKVGNFFSTFHIMKEKWTCSSGPCLEHTSPEVYFWSSFSTPESNRLYNYDSDPSFLIRTPKASAAHEILKGYWKGAKVFSVCISYALLKYKIGVDIKELIRVDIFTLVAFNSYYDPSPPSMEVVANSISSLWKFLKYISVHILLPDETVIGCTLVLQVVH